MAETNDDFVGSLRALIKSELIDVNTSINGEIVSYSNGFATVRPTANKSFADGDSLAYPLIYKCPVRWPSFNGGQCGFKGPIKQGDQVLVVFAQQATDGTDDLRKFDLNDAYCIPAHNAMSGQGANNDDTIMYFGSAYIKISASGEIEINAPGGCKTIAPTNEFTGAVTIKGLLSYLAGMVGFGASTSNGKNISDTHYHINSGGSGNGGPVA